MNEWTQIILRTIVHAVIDYEHDYYCQIHNMKYSFMFPGHYQQFLPKTNIEDYLNIVDVAFKNDYLSKVKTVIDCSYYYSCKMGMDNAHMYPDEIMSHIDNLLKLKPDEAFENIKISKQKLLALKLDKELPKKDGMQEKRIKI